MGYSDDFLNILIYEEEIFMLLLMIVCHFMRNGESVEFIILSLDYFKIGIPLVCEEAVAEIFTFLKI